MNAREKLCAERARIQSDNKLRSVLMRVPQKRVSASELAVYFVVPLLLIAAGAMPSTAIFLMPIILPLLYLLFRRFGAALPFSCVAFYGVFSLVLNYDILSVVYLCFLLFALSGLILSAQLSPYLLSMAICAIFAVAGAAVGFGVVRAAEGEPLGNVAAHYVEAERDDPFIRFLAHDYYESTDIPEDIGRLQPGDEGYEAAAVRFFSEYAYDEFEAYTPYLCVHYGGVFAIAAYFFAIAVNKRTACFSDFGVTKKQLAHSTRCRGGALCEKTRVGDMRFPRSYLLSVFLPAFTASLILDAVGGYEALSATLMHAFITLPSAVAFLTLSAYFCNLFVGKKRVAAYVVLFSLSAACLVFSIALFICSMIGLCDILLNIRFWTEFVVGDD